MLRIKLILLSIVASVALVACQWQAPTSSATAGQIALTLNFAQWQEHAGDEGLRLARSRAAITRVEVYVLFVKDTLAHATAPVAAGANEFSAALEVAIGAERRVIVEAWDDQDVAGAPVRLFRGVQSGVEVQPNLAQEVAVTLYPLPVAGTSVVLIVGSAQGAPGASNQIVPLTLISADSLSGVQFDLNYAGNIITPLAAVRTKAIAFDTLASNLVASEQGQALRALLFSTTGKRLPPLYDPTTIVNLAWQVNANAPLASRSALTLANLVVLDAQRKRLGVLAVNGEFVVGR